MQWVKEQLKYNITYLLVHDLGSCYVLLEGMCITENCLYLAVQLSLRLAVRLETWMLTDVDLALLVVQVAVTGCHGYATVHEQLLLLPSARLLGQVKRHLAAEVRVSAIGRGAWHWAANSVPALCYLQ